jgi:hypothetical protein
MAGYDIGPRIGIKGEAEFNKQIKNINNSLREYGSEMKALTAEFANNENSQQALIAKSRVMEKQLDAQKQKLSTLQDQYDKEVQKLRELATEYQRVKTEMGENSAEAGKAEAAYNKQAESVSKLKVAMNETQGYINNLNNSIGKNANMLDEIESGARDAATGLSRLSDEADEADKSLDDIASASKSEALSSLAEGISSAGEAMKSVVEESKEYLKIMGQLEASSKNLGYSTKETKQTYTQLYGVLGDNQTAATATANLQALGLSQGQLTKMTDAAIGAWAQYGDSIPIDSLAEAINETAQTGTVTGTFADVLNWAGTSEDAFNQKLQSTTDKTERANMILQEMARQGLIESAEGFRENNEALIESNEAQARYEEAMSRLAEAIMPAVTNAMNIAAGVLEKVAGFFTSLPEPVQQFLTILGTLIVIFGALAPVILSVAAALTMLQAPLLPIIGIVAAVVAGITLLVAAFQHLWTTNEGFREAVGEIWAQIQSAISVAIETIKQIISAFVELASIIWEQWGDTIMAVVQNTVTMITTWIQEGLNIIQNIIKFFSSILQGDWRGAWEAVKSILSSVLTIIKTLVSTAFNNLVTIISSIGSKIGSAVKNAFQSAINFITSLPSKAIGWGKDFINGLAKGVMSGVNKIVGAVKDVANKIRSFLHFSRPDEGPLRDYETWMPDMLTGMADTIYKNLGIISRAASAVSGTINGAITEDRGGVFSAAAASYSSSVIVQGDQIILDGKVIGRTADKYITNNQIANIKARGGHV